MTDDVPDTVRADELPFEPGFPWVYYCHGCGDYFDPNETSQHDPQQVEDHPAVVTVERVEVVR